MGQKLRFVDIFISSQKFVDFDTSIPENPYDHFTIRRISYFIKKALPSLKTVDYNFESKTSERN